MTTTTKTNGKAPGKATARKAGTPAKAEPPDTTGEPAKVKKPAAASKAGTNGGGGSADGTVLPHQTVWEDTVILAFRDLQWHRWHEAFLKGTALQPSPADLHKLDYDAESAFGDVLTSQDDRFFVFEFKAVRDGHLDERGKGLFERLSHYVAAAENLVDENGRYPEPLQDMIDLSRRCHFGVFGLRVALPPGETTTAAPSGPPSLVDMPFVFQKGEASKNDASPAVPALPAGAVKLRLLADPYIEWVHLANRALAAGAIKKRIPSEQIAEQQATADAEVGEATTLLAQAKAAASKKAKQLALAALSKAFKGKIQANRDERAAQLAKGKTAIERISINEIVEPIPLETIVWEPLPNTNYGVSQHDLALYLAALIDMPGPGQPDDGIRVNLVRVRNGREVVQWTVTLAEIRDTIMVQTILAANVEPAEQVQSDINVPAEAPPSQHTKVISVGANGTETESEENGQA